MIGGGVKVENTVTGGRVDVVVRLRVKVALEI